MNYLDIFLLVPLVWAAYKGFTKGLIVELASLVALLLGIYCSIHFSHFISEFLINTVGVKFKYISVLSFVITFLLVIIVIYTLAHLMSKTLELIALGIFNKILGAIFGIIKIGFIFSILLYVINTYTPIAKLIPENQRNNSMLYKPLTRFAVLVFPKIKSLGTYKIIN